MPASKPDKPKRKPRATSPEQEEKRHEDIRRVVLDLVADRGVEGVTIDAIASAAQASKQTLYKKWATKDELIRDAINASFEGARPGDPGDHGSLKVELKLILDSAATMLRAHRRLIIALIDGAQRDASVMAIMRQETRDNYRDALQRPLKRAIARGEIGPETDLNLIPDVALPVMLHRAMLNEMIDERVVNYLLEEVVMRLVR